jgi:hypothetical protein
MNPIAIKPSQSNLSEKHDSANFTDIKEETLYQSNHTFDKFNESLLKWSN